MWSIEAVSGDVLFPTQVYECSALVNDQVFRVLYCYEHHVRRRTKENRGSDSQHWQETIWQGIINYEDE